MAFACTSPAVPTILADDKRVRITRWDFEPGSTTGWHEHAMDYSIVFVTDGLMAIDVDGVVTELSMRAGEAYSRPAGIRHDVKNAGSAKMSFVEVEIK